MKADNYNIKIFALIAASLLLSLGSLFFGASPISPARIFTSGSPDFEVFWWLRVPRTLAGFLGGAGLAVGGMVFQALFRNPLATPFTLGVSSGAALGASLYFQLGLSVSILGSLGSLGSALLGGLLSMLLVYMLTRSKGGFSTPVMLLAGVIVSFFFSSLVLFVQYLSDATDSMRILHWLMGSLAGPEIPRLADLSFIIIAGSWIIWRLSPEIDLLSTGDELAASRGINTSRVKVWLFVVVSLMVGAIVSMIGPIGFVGMIIPHICRLWLGWVHRLLLPAVFFSGGCFLVLCDLLARLVMAPAELPIGIITALIGGPFFLWVLFKTNSRGEFY